MSPDAGQGSLPQRTRSAYIFRSLMSHPRVIGIVGGTGLYDNARGTLTVTATHLRPRHEVLIFRLVG